MTALQFMILAGVLGATGVVAAVSMKAAERRRAGSQLVAYALRFPRGMEVEAVAAVLAGLTGWLPPWWRRWIVTPFTVFEIVATSAGITHRVLVPDSWSVGLERLLIAHVPGVRFDRLGHAPDVEARVASSYRLSSGHRPLRVDAVAQARTLLAAAQPLGTSESIVVQWIVSPNAPVQPARTAKAGEQSLVSGATVMRTAEATAALRAKQAHPQLLSVLRIGASAGSDDRARGLVRRMETALHLANAPGAHLRRHLLQLDRQEARQLRARRVPFAEWPIILNTVEFVGLLGWPVGVDDLPGLELGGCRHLPPSPVIPTVGTVLGDSNAHGVSRPVAINIEGRYRHQVLVGPTGTGKTTLLLNMALGDIEAGRSVLVIDPKADLVEDLLARIPDHRVEDVVVLDVADAERPVGINSLRMTGIGSELAAEQLVSILHRIFSASWGVRSDDLWRAALRTIITDPSGTLADVGPLLTDAAFRSTLTAKLTDPTLVGFWRAFENLSAGEQNQHAGPVLNKWRAIMGRPGLRRMFGQAHPSFDLAKSLNGGGIVLVPLAAGQIGEDAAALVGAVLLNSVWNVVQARAAVAADRRRPLMVYLDEFVRYVALPVPLEEMLAQARSYKVGITLATQHLHQLPADLRHSVLANPRSRAAFQVGHADAQILAREFGMGLTTDDLQGLDAYDVVAQLYAAGRSQPACTLTTRPAPEASRDPAAIREASRQRWGADGEAVDTSLRERMTPPTASSGRDRKQPGRRPRGAK